jgi:hypothetical protein
VKKMNEQLVEVLDLIRTDPRVVTVDENTVVHRALGEWTLGSRPAPDYVHPLGSLGGGVVASLVDLPADTQVLCLAHEDGDFAVVYARGIQAREELFRVVADRPKASRP